MSRDRRYKPRPNVRVTTVSMIRRNAMRLIVIAIVSAIFLTNMTGCILGGT